jgi:hypothetical protein
MPYSPTGINVDVVLSGQHATSVKPLTGGDVSVLLSGQSTTVTAQDGMTIGMQLPGIQGPAGQDTAAFGIPGSIQYNDGGSTAGADNVFYDKASDKITISGGALVINKGQFILSGDAEGGNAASFLVKDESATLINIDPVSKSITFSENASNNEYYIGIGHSQPEEKLHIKNGNLRVDGDIIVSGSLKPAEANKFDLGSSTAPFKDLYLAGDSIIFPAQQSKLSVEDNSIVFLKDIYDTPKELFKVEKVGNSTIISGITVQDSVIRDVDIPDGTLEYNAIKSGGAFASKRIPDGATNVFMYFGQDLGYIPKVVCTLIAPPDSEEMYFYMIENIKSSGCDVFFSSPVLQPSANSEDKAFEIQCFAAPKTGENYYHSISE